MIRSIRTYNQKYIAAADVPAALSIMPKTEYGLLYDPGLPAYIAEKLDILGDPEVHCPQCHHIAKLVVVERSMAVDIVDEEEQELLEKIHGYKSVRKERVHSETTMTVDSPVGPLALDSRRNVERRYLCTNCTRGSFIVPEIKSTLEFARFYTELAVLSDPTILVPSKALMVR